MTNKNILNSCAMVLIKNTLRFHFNLKEAREILGTLIIKICMILQVLLTDLYQNIVAIYR